MASLMHFFIPFVALMPAVVSAQNFLTQATGLFNIFVGLMLTAALLLYGGGFMMWLTRLGTWPTYRTEGTRIMEWSVITLFVLILILMVVQFFRDHSQIALYIVAGIVIFAIALVLLTDKSGSKEKKEGGGR